MDQPVRTTVCIIGAGLSGLAMAVALDRAGIRAWVLLDKGAEVGGTWRDNRYPGAACDVPSHLYSYSFALEPSWRRRYAGQAEIQDYQQAVATRWGLRDRLWLRAEATQAAFDEGRGLWRVLLADGRSIEAGFLVNALGPLRDPRWPDLPGLSGFAGALLHSSRWDPGLDLSGARVGVIGTGASAIQLVPRLARDARQLVVCQRTPPWVLPRRDRAYGPATRRLLGSVPGLLRLYRGLLYARQEAQYPLVFRRRTPVALLGEAQARRHLRRQVYDPALRDALTPRYRMGCKRILLADDYYPTFNLPHVRLETRRIAAVTPGGLRLEGGEELALDALVCATGYAVDRPLGALVVRGLGGRELGAWWGPRPRALLGIAVPGFPRCYALLGPNTGLGHNSMILMIEAQVRYVVQAIQHHLDRPALAWLDLREEALQGFVAELDRRHQGQVWASGCQSWYLGQGAVNFTLWPGSTVEYLLRTRRFDPAPYSASMRAAT